MAGRAHVLLLLGAIGCGRIGFEARDLASGAPLLAEDLAREQDAPPPDLAAPREEPPPDLVPPADRAPPDLVVTLDQAAADLGSPPDEAGQDLSSAPDQATQDLVAPPDQATRDLAAFPDLAAPTCTDKVANGAETGVDCGGPCPPCAEGQGCKVAGDCASGACLATGKCGQASCLGLQGYWRMDEGADWLVRDASGLGNHGTNSGGAQWASGKLGKALYYDGGGWTYVPDQPSLDPHRSDFAVEAWVMIPLGQLGHQRIVAHGTHGPGGHDGYSLMQWCAWGDVACGGMSLLFGSEGRGEFLVGTCASSADGQWHHYVGQVERAGKMELWVDGAKLAAPCSGTYAGQGWAGGEALNVSHLSTVDIDCPCALCIGASCQVDGECSGTSEPFTGSVDEVAFYGRRLTAVEIMAHYNAGAGRLVCGQ